VKIENLSHEMTVTFDDDEDIVTGARHAASQGENNEHVWSVFLVLTLEQWSPERMKLQELGFLPAGFVTVDAKTNVKVKKSIRKSSESQGAGDVDLAISPPTLPPTSTEQSAIDELLRRPEFKRFKGMF
jgi:hypothetical protein